MVMLLNQVWKAIGLLILSTACVSCSILKSPHYVGEQEAIREEDLASETVWMQGDDVYFVKRVDSNTVVAATLDWDAKANNFRIRSYPIILSSLGEYSFLNVKEDENYSIFRVIGTDDEETLLLFTIDGDKLEQDIADGKIKARASGDDIVMECTKEEQDAYMRANVDLMFDMNSAFLARKISREQACKSFEP